MPLKCQNELRKLSLPRTPSNEGIKEQKHTIIIFGFLSVVVVSEVGSVMGYGAVCTCSADMLEELAASIFGVRT